MNLPICSCVRGFLSCVCICVCVYMLYVCAYVCIHVCAYLPILHDLHYWYCLIYVISVSVEIAKFHSEEVAVANLV